MIRMRNPPSILQTDLDAQPLTSAAHWDTYWEHAPALPAEAHANGKSSTRAILEVIDRFVAWDPPRTVLEVGGAPGGYAAHLYRRFGHEICVLDSSPVGIDMTRKNFEMLGIQGRVLHRDLFSTEAPTPQFDVVFSLGLIEHFADTRAVVAAHLAYVKPGGRLIIGCPNLLGINRALLRRLAPSALEWHHLEAMDIREWPRFEQALGLRVRFRGYVAGFQPGTFWRCDHRSLLDRALARGFTALDHRWRGPLARAFTRLNSRHWSYYAIGVYDKSDNQ
jgi:SAM-dependent methyltransferase